MNWSPSKYPLIINPYDSFMKKHLQHYGYYTGRSMAIARLGYEPKRGYKNNDFSDDSEECESDCESDTGSKKIDWKNRPNKFSENYKWWLKDNLGHNISLKSVEYQREPRWPTEMQVLPEKIRHIDTGFPEPEHYNVKTGLEETPMPSSNDTKSKTIFYYNPINVGYYMRSRVGGNREGCQKLGLDAVPEIDVDNTLMFESRFESGNLMKAVKINDTEYELYMRYDLYTSRHTQWFYFQIKNAKPGRQYRFTICNFLKSDSLYNAGMKPVMYSEEDAKSKNIGWRRWGQNIKYYRNNIRSEDEYGNNRNLYSLTWTCQFPNDQSDTYYFAHCYPYTYTDLQDYIKNIQDDPVKSKFCKVKILCRSLAENLVHLLTVTSSTGEQDGVKKKAIVVTARVHPGETNASWMMKGFLDYLLGDTADAKLLRDNFIFKVIPMLNPDGVIVGNYRCSLTGRDLNRNYKTMLKDAFPSIWHTREMVKKLLHEREVIMYCDFHGHSRKNNVFIYGCNNNNSPKRRFHEHIFPIIMSRNGKNHFSYKSCKFKVQKSKQGTGRIVMWNLGVMNSFTMEATFSGSTLNALKDIHFGPRELEEMGYIFCDSVLDYCDPDQSKCKQILKDVEGQMRETLRIKLGQRGINVENMLLMEDFDILSVNFDDDENSSAGESDSSGDDGLPLHLERFGKVIRPAHPFWAYAFNYYPSPNNPSSSYTEPQTQQKVLTKKQPNKDNKKNERATEPKVEIDHGDSHINNNKFNKSMNDFIQKANEAALIAANTKVIEPKPNNIILSSDAKVYVPPERKEKSALTANAKPSEGLMKKDDRRRLSMILYRRSKSALVYKKHFPVNPTVNPIVNEKPYFRPSNESEKKQLRPLKTAEPPTPVPHACSAKSTKGLNNGIPVFTEERANIKKNQNLQMQIEAEAANTRDDQLAFRYTISNGTHTPPPHNHSQSSLCEHHKKKLSDLFLIRHLTDENREEDDGNLSDDEADLNDDLDETDAKRKPTLEEYVKRHVFKRSESHNHSRLSRLAPTQQTPVVISFNTPTPQPQVRIRSQLGVSHIDQTPTTDYKSQQMSQTQKPSKTKSDVVVNLDKRTIESASMVREKADRPNSSDKIANRPPVEQAHPNPGDINECPSVPVSKPGTVENTNSHTQQNRPVSRKHSMEKKQQSPLKPTTPKKHKVERIDLNIESIITETYLQSQQKARQEAEKQHEKQAEKLSVYKQKTGTADSAKDNRAGSPELDEQIEEDIIVYQNHEFASPSTKLSPNTAAKNEKFKQESFKNHLFNQIQNQKRAANEQSSHRIIPRDAESHNESSQQQNQHQQQQPINKNTDKISTTQNGDKIIYQSPKIMKSEGKHYNANYHSNGSDLPVPTLPERVNAQASNKQTYNRSDIPNKNTNRPEPKPVIETANSTLNSSSLRSREKQEKPPVEAVPIQQFGTDLKPYKDPHPNPVLQLFQTQTNLNQQNQQNQAPSNPNRYSNLIMNNHHVHMQQQPQLEIQKIPLQNYKDKYENSVDLFDFKTENSITSASTKNAMESMPKYLLKQNINERRVTKNSGNSMNSGQMAGIVTSNFGAYNPKNIPAEAIENTVGSARQLNGDNSTMVVRDTINRRSNSKGLVGKQSSNLLQSGIHRRNTTRMFGIGDKLDPTQLAENINANYNKISDELLSSLNKAAQNSSSNNFKELIHNTGNQGAKQQYSNNERQISNKPKK